MRSGVTVLAAMAVLSACGSSGAPAAGGSPSPSCVILPRPQTVSAADSGKTVCLKVGDELAVVLRTPPQEEIRFWKPVQDSDPSVLAPSANGALTLARGATGANYRAVASGTAVLTSYRFPCAGQATASPCYGSDQFTVRVVVASS